MRSPLLVAGVLAMGVTVGGCSRTDDAVVSAPSDVAADSEAPTTASVSGLPDITFDPCAAIDDATLVRFGFDPATRFAENSSIGIRELETCTVDGYDRSLNVIAQNRPWEELPSTLSGPTESIDVNGREAIHATDAMGTPSCTVLMRTGFGAVIIDVAIYRQPDSPADLNACDGIMQIAETVEPLIDS